MNERPELKLELTLAEGRDRDSEVWLEHYNPRLSELLDRLVAIGNPHSKFSCSEFHELHDGVMDMAHHLYRHIYKT